MATCNVPQSLLCLRPANRIWQALRTGLSSRTSFSRGHAAAQLRPFRQALPSHPIRTSSTAAGAATAVAAEAAAAAATQGAGAATAAASSTSAAPELLLYNTMGRQKQPFQPRPGQGNRVSMYVCGVTVYDYSHIGHARAYVSFDVLYRYLQHLGFDVTYVRNFTDVDDKIINRANALGEDPLALSQRFINEFHADMAALNCLPPNVEPKATEYITHMVEMIQQIISNGHAYVVDGDVYFDVASLPGYGMLSGRAQEDNRAGERVAVDDRKRGPADFALWKAAKPGEPTWDSPWGPGRPGWHIECSTMIREVMGPIIDIHGGGRDLVFPHHENELAQSRAAAGSCSCGQEHPIHPPQEGSDPPFVRYWVHNGFVNVDSEKMSKSLGNFFTIREVVTRYHPRALRWFLVNTQYRQPINYTQRALEEASDRLYYLYQTLADTAEALGTTPEGQAALQQAQQHAPPAAAAAEGGSGSGSSSGSGSGSGKGGEGSGGSGADEAVGQLLLQEALAAFSDDLNTPLAVAALSAPLKLMNDLLHTKKGKKQAGRLQALVGYHEALRAVLGLLGLWTDQPQQVLQELRHLALVRAGLSEDEVAAAIQERAEARAAKDYAASDAVRARLEAVGILIMDTPQGTTWKPGPRLNLVEEDRAAGEGQQQL